MTVRNPFSELNRFEWILYILSSVAVILTGVFGGGDGWMSTGASFIGVTALIFVAKGDVFGQILTLIFAVFYGIISWSFDYYGEMVTYMCMTAPIALASVISWIRHPYKDSHEVEVAVLSSRNIVCMWVLTVAVTGAFYFILGALGNANLLVSTLSVTTSFLASYLTLFRSPYYAVAYAANDVVLIVLWVMASMTDIKYLSMVVCFIAFFANDMYGFYNWKRMQKFQRK
ncbi:MAG: nicotinamide mononucleotide transporter [Clostridia bacterium]|nr:nicotinamide mononucleotide transporter [Clostridia bacterium]